MTKVAADHASNNHCFHSVIVFTCIYEVASQRLLTHGHRDHFFLVCLSFCLSTFPSTCLSVHHTLIWWPSYTCTMKHSCYLWLVIYELLQLLLTIYWTSLLQDLSKWRQSRKALKNIQSHWRSVTYHHKTPEAIVSPLRMLLVKATLLLVSTLTVCNEQFSVLFQVL